MEKIKLTIGIPTYNRCNDLDNILKSILEASIQEENLILKIIICDNNSTDKTKEIVDKWSNNLDISYYKNSINIGVIQNIIKVAELHDDNGYFWFMGDDDAITSDALSKVYNSINENSFPSFVLLNRMICDSKMLPIKKDKYIDSLNDKSFIINDNKGFLNYLDSVNTLGGVFGLISSVIVDDKFTVFLKEELKTDLLWKENLFPHIYFILKYMYDKCNKETIKLQYISDTFLHFRSGIISKEARNIDNKNLNSLIDFEHLYTIANKVLKKKNIRNSFLSIIKKHYSLRLYLSVKSSLKNDEVEYFEYVHSMINPCLGQKNIL